MVDALVWERLAGQAAGLFDGHLAASQEVGGAGEDAALRGMMRDLLAAVSDEFDGDGVAAAGALALALAEVSGEVGA